jgi:acetyl-CoA C-acetyltransferase
MGCFAEATAARYGFTRAAQDDFARESATPCASRRGERRFCKEIAPVTAKTRKGETAGRQGRDAGHLDIAKIPGLKAAFPRTAR